MHGPPEPDKWKVLNLNDTYAAGMAYSRLTWLMNYDPYVGILNKWTQDALANLIFSDECLGSKSLDNDSWGAEKAIYQALDRSPLALLLSPQFKSHIASLAKVAVFAGDPDKP
jgi:hypothetical protein